MVTIIDHSCSTSSDQMVPYVSPLPLTNGVLADQSASCLAPTAGRQSKPISKRLNALATATMEHSSRSKEEHFGLNTATDAPDDGKEKVSPIPGWPVFSGRAGQGHSPHTPRRDDTSATLVGQSDEKGVAGRTGERASEEMEEAANLLKTDAAVHHAKAGNTEVAKGALDKSRSSRRKNATTKSATGKSSLGGTTGSADSGDGSEVPSPPLLMATTTPKRRLKTPNAGRGKRLDSRRRAGSHGCQVHTNKEECAAAMAALGTTVGEGKKVAICCTPNGREGDSRACKCKGRRKCLICRGCAGGHCACVDCLCETCRSREHQRLAKEKTLRETEEREVELAKEQERIFQEARERQQMRDAGVEVAPPTSPLRSPIAHGQSVPDVHYEARTTAETSGGKGTKEAEVTGSGTPPAQGPRERGKNLDSPPFLMSCVPALVSSVG